MLNVISNFEINVALPVELYIIKNMKEDKIIANVRKCLYENIYENINLTSYEDQRLKVSTLIQSTVEYGEANSALVIGPRGSGKTTLVQDVLKEVTSKKSFIDNSFLVELNGLIHTNDNLALKSITRQMNLLNVVEGKVFGSFAENFAFLLASLKSGQKESSKSVIFILDEFDFFCAHHNQTLLYNLFDISQSAQTAICVLGITCRLDVMELLEKRIKSRFSHRQIFTFADTHSDENQLFEAQLKNVNELLTIAKSVKGLSTSYKNNWNKHIQDLMKNKQMKNIIQRLIDINIDKNCLKNFLTSVILNLQDDDAVLSVSQFQEQLELFERDEKVQVLKDLNVLELCLIIAMKHHTEIYVNQPMNFEMILTRYMKFANANSSIQSVQRPVIMKAFEHLQHSELIALVTTGGSKFQKEYQLFKLLATSKQIAEAVKLSPGLPTEVIQWANSSLI
ncbi:hypothetical protein WA026_002171 [Henosepilachna vigintioctopunctata]|uniref:Origin recognition complex subunit 4 n=1 Tax=Henosepilachna vigintioctopunctata TaxID=420089 RepID=A0AAW1TZG7_9CUCU